MLNIQSEIYECQLHILNFLKILQYKCCSNQTRAMQIADHFLAVNLTKGGFDWLCKVDQRHLRLLTQLATVLDTGHYDSAPTLHFYGPLILKKRTIINATTLFNIFAYLLSLWQLFSMLVI